MLVVYFAMAVGSVAITGCPAFFWMGEMIRFSDIPYSIYPDIFTIGWSTLLTQRTIIALSIVGCFNHGCITSNKAWFLYPPEQSEQNMDPPPKKKKCWCLKNGFPLQRGIFQLVFRDVHPAKRNGETKHANSWKKEHHPGQPTTLGFQLIQLFLFGAEMYDFHLESRSLGFRILYPLHQKNSFIHQVTYDISPCFTSSQYPTGSMYGIIYLRTFNINIHKK